LGTLGWLDLLGCGPSSPPLAGRGTVEPGGVREIYIEREMKTMDVYVANTMIRLRKSPNYSIIELQSWANSVFSTPRAPLNRGLC
jgi:hypothetical protein